MKIKVLNSDGSLDRRVNGFSWMCKMKIGDYFHMVDLEGNPYQRNFLGTRFYKKLISDLLLGTVIPPISVMYPIDPDQFTPELNIDNKFIILDGLQRTNCLLECEKILKKNTGDNKTIYTSVSHFLESEIYVEIWSKLDLKNILYKMVVLNTGQKKMDYSHQLDILNSSIYDKLINDEIRVVRKKDNISTKYISDSFELSTITEGLVSFINRTPISGKKNAAEFLFERLNIDSDDVDIEINLIYDDKTYEYLIWTLKTFSTLLKKRYGNRSPLQRYDIFLTSFMASLGYCYLKNPKNLEKKIKILEQSLIDSDSNDPLKIDTFEAYYGKFKSGIGDKRRKLIYEAFREYFIQPEYIDVIEWESTYDRYF